MGPTQVIPLTYKAEVQPYLFSGCGDRRMKTNAEVRNWVGDYFEFLTQQVTGARRIKTDSQQLICPDLHWYETTFIESKGVGKTNHVIIYKTRQEKDLQFIEAGHSLYYFIWNHKAHCYQHEFRSTLQVDLLDTLKTVFVVPHSVIVKIISILPLRVLNTAYTKDRKHKLGYGQRNTGEGWSIGLQHFRDQLHRESKFCIEGREVEVLWLQE